jgi:hypothetical protein
MEIHDVAAICHEANRRLCITQGDYTHHPWEASPDWQQESALNGVGFHLENPDASPAASHESWYREKEAAGWTYGAVKNADLKQHPCMVPFEHLPPEQQAKDHLFKAIVNSLARFVVWEKEAA